MKNLFSDVGCGLDLGPGEEVRMWSSVLLHWQSSTCWYIRLRISLSFSWAGDCSISCFHRQTWGSLFVSSYMEV